MGLLYTPDHGYAAFTVPDFDKFMLRAVPTLDVPPSTAACASRQRVAIRAFVQGEPSSEAVALVRSAGSSR